MKELLKLKREIEELRKENLFLKKAIATTGLMVTGV